MSERVCIELHPNIADSVRRIAAEYRMKQRTGLSSYEKQMLRCLEDAIEATQVKEEA